MSIRGVLSVAAGLLVFLGLMAMVGQVHVGEFFMCIFIATVVALIVFFKTPRSWTFKTTPERE